MSSYTNLAFIASLAYRVVSLSLPPLRPSIPDAAEPVSSKVGELLVRHEPPPPLDSPPFQCDKSIKPGKIGYFWTGSGDKSYKDFLATYSLDDDTFGELLWVTDVPTGGNEPHHLGISSDGKTLVGGGLLSLLSAQDTAFYFDVTDPYQPNFKKSNQPSLSAVTDEFWAKPGGGFFITQMGSALGTSPGRLVETDAEFNIVHEWPEDADGTANILGEQFSPHGLCVDIEKNIILTSDFVVPASILKPTSGVEFADTLRLWELSSRRIISTITIPDGGGIQDVKFIPGNPESAAIATAIHLGQVWVIYPFRKDADGNQGVAELLFDLGPKARDVVAMYTSLTQDGRFLYLTLTTANHVAALDITDLNNVKRLDDPDEEQPIVSPHYVKVTPDQKHLLMIDYFVQTGDIGVVNIPADYKVLYLDINDDGSLSFNRTIDFVGDFAGRGGAKPHSAVIFDLTDPENPLYY
ncbi:hypothetical protein B0A52_01124 [Exophiala mesophila]|uniref:Uncharacterized protein n=1 Tax=Exophiala mesophila TaxID=212818 RepID=A0A438NGK3_EXOME|nr:hypothetical protein B0A52_01124 [Exophiala mesophila]